MKSNHPSTVLRDILKKINKRLSELSCNEEGYKKAEPLYETALNESWDKTTMAYTEKQQSQAIETENLILNDLTSFIAKMLEPTSEHFIFQVNKNAFFKRTSDI